MRAQLTNRDYEQLSAYIDGQLTPRERERLEVRLQTQPELQTALDDLNRTRTLLRQAPRHRAPRNFTLTPAMAEQIRPRRAKSSAWTFFPALSFASALATLLLVASFVFQLLPGASMTAYKAAPAAQNTTNAEAPSLAAGAPSEKRAVPESATAAPAGAAAPAAAAQPAGTTAPGVMAAAPDQTSNTAGGQAAASGSTAAEPPVVAWNGGSPYATGPGGGYGMGGGGGGGGGGASVPPAGQLLGPPQAPAYGKMGEGAQTMIYGAPVDASGAPANSLTIPQQGVNSLSDAERSASNQPAQPNPSISGSGPILGVPSQGQGGQIVDQRALLGHPENVQPAVEPTQAQPAGQPGETLVPAQPESQPAAQPVAPVSLPILQGLLAVIALATGTAAFILWRRRS